MEDAAERDCVPPPNRRSAPVQSKLPVWVPLSWRVSSPLWTSTVPVFENGHEITMSLALVVRLNVPELLIVPVPARNASVWWSHVPCCVIVPGVLTLKPPVPENVAVFVAGMISVRVRILPLDVVKLTPPFAVVAPVPDIVPPPQVNSPDGVIASEPPSVPLVKLSVAGAMVSPLLNVIDPLLTESEDPTLVTVDVPENTFVPNDCVVDPVTL